MKRLIPLIFFTACISFDQLKPVKSDKPGVVYLTGYSDTLRIDTLQLDGDKIYIKLKKEANDNTRNDNTRNGIPDILLFKDLYNR